jgi:putative PEP-CTERM system TPR-repeat lipoprotein
MPASNSNRSFSFVPRHILGMAVMIGIGWFAPALAWAVDAKASKYYEDALTRYEKEDAPGAIIQLKNALQIDKTMLPVHMLLGKALMQNGEVAAAEVAFGEALRLGVNRAEVVVPLGQAFLAQGKHKLILEQPLFNVIGLPIEVQAQVWLLKSAASADMGDLRTALKSVDEARILAPRSASSWLAEVPIRIRGKQWKEANIATEQALELAPNSAEAWYQKGAVAHVSGNLTLTLAAYNKALLLDPKHMEARVARAGIYLDMNRLAEAQVDVDELRRNSAREPRAAYLQALLAERAGQPGVAQKALKDLVALIDPVPLDFIRYRPQLLMLNGLAHFGLHEPEKAKQYLEEFQKAQANTPVAKLLAQIYLSQSNANRAVDLLEAYLKVNPADGQAMTLLGSVLMSKGQHARAVALMQQALQNNDAPEFRTVLGLSLIRSGQAGNGIAELEAAFKKDPRQTQAATTLVGMYLRSGQPAKAVTLADTLVKQHPTNAGYLNLQGMAKIQSGKVAEAKTAFEQAVKLDSAMVEPKLNLARLDIATRAFDAAAARLTAILKSDEKNTEAMYEMAVLSERRGQAAEAQRWLEKATDHSGPKEVRWGLELSAYHLRNGRAGPALDAVKRVSGKLPDDLGVLMAYARAQLASGDTVGAKSNLTAATRVADYNPQRQVDIAMLQMAAKNPSGAAYSLEKALSTQADYLPAMALMAEVELRLGEPAKAEKRAHAIVSKYPKRAVGLSLLGDIAQSRGQPSQALEAYRRAHQVEPSTATFLQLFVALSPQDGGKSALPMAQQWTKAHPKDAPAHKAVANALARNGQFPAAKTAFENLLKLSPDDSDALNNLANVLLRLKDPAAIQVAEQAVAKNPNDFNAIDTLGWALFQAGQTDRALQYLRDARLRQPTNAEIRYHLAAVLAKTGRTTEAREELEAALKSGREFEGLVDAQALLKTLQP